MYARPAPNPPVVVERDQQQSPPYRADEHAGFGTLSVRVKPPDAVILIDGEVWDRSPGDSQFSIELTEGVHQIEIGKEGYGSYAMMIEREPRSRVHVERGPDAARSGPETNQPCRRDRALTVASRSSGEPTSSRLRRFAFRGDGVVSRTPVLLRCSIDASVRWGDGEVARAGDMLACYLLIVAWSALLLFRSSSNQFNTTWGSVGVGICAGPLEHR